MGTIFYWVYILNCDNGAYYTGYTSDLKRRFQEHIQGVKCKYTRSFKPLSIARCWQVEGGKAEAMKVEMFIKRMSKREKERLILEPQRLVEVFEFVRCG